jgi:hypothetical protein
MIRTQVYLTDEQHRAVQLTAKREGKKAAEVIREALAKGLQANRQPTSTGEALLGLAALGRKLNLQAEPDFLSRIDDYLYGEK